MMALSLVQSGLGLFSGSLVGFSLGLVGGGGSILAVPLLIYLVGIGNPHLAIGTSAVAVAVNAAANLLAHARAGNVKWRCASVYALAGVAGAFFGSTLGKMVDGQKLLVLFAVLMIVVSFLMLKGRSAAGDPSVRLNRENLPKLLGFGTGTGALSGFFGIGGGFLIVPGLMLASGMPILNAVGSSLVAVTAFGLTTAANYAASGTRALDAVGPVCRGRRARRSARSPRCPDPLRPEGCAEHRIRRPDRCGSGLHVGAKPEPHLMTSVMAINHTARSGRRVKPLRSTPDEVLPCIQAVSPLPLAR